MVSLIPEPIDLSEGRDKVSHLVAYGSLMFWFGMLYPGLQRQAPVALGFAAMGVGVVLGWGIAQTPLRRIYTPGSIP